MRRKRARGFTLIEVVIAIAIIAAVVLGVIYFLGHGEEKVEGETVKEVTGWEGGLRDNLKTICIDGFEYYFSAKKNHSGESSHSRAILAPVFDKQDRLPKRCRVER